MAANQALHLDAIPVRYMARVNSVLCRRKNGGQRQTSRQAAITWPVRFAYVPTLALCLGVAWFLHHSERLIALSADRRTTAAIDEKRANQA